jgi:hypothetical protein
MKVHAVTVGDDATKAHILTDSLRRYGHGECRVLGNGQPWLGGTMAGPGGGQKINLMKEYLNNPPPADQREGETKSWTENDLILFSDGYDTSVSGTPEEFIRKWKWFGADVVFGAESANWPGGCLNQPDVPGRFKFLNSGGYIGRATVLREMFNSREIENHADDQLFCQELYASGKWKIKLDHRKEIFCCLSDHVREHRDAVQRGRFQDWPVKNIGPAGPGSPGEREIYFVMETQTYPLQLHGNGVSKNVWHDVIKK